MTPDQIARLCPGFVADGPLLRTDTSHLLPGTIDGSAVLAKWPRDRRPFWLDRCRHELAIYRTLPAPVPTPALIAGDPTVPLLVMTRLPGQVLHPERYPTGPVAGDRVAALLDALDHLHTWRPAAGTVPHDADYADQLAGLRAQVLTDDDQRLLAELFTASAPGVRVEHGDAHLGNAVHTPTGVALIDLEFVAWRPAGYDLAKLWIYLGPPHRPQLEAHIGGTVAEAVGFWLAVVLVAAREIASYRRDPTQPGGQHRLRHLDRDLRIALRHTRDLHAHVR